MVIHTWNKKIETIHLTVKKGESSSFGPYKVYGCDNGKWYYRKTINISRFKKKFEYFEVHEVEDDFPIVYLDEDPVIFMGPELY